MNNTGYCNTGDCNTGYRNTGDRNTGDCNTGGRNTGDRNTGDCNTGNWNTGDCNTGNHNTGDWNTGDCNIGYCNTDEPSIRIFNKETNFKRNDIIFPNFFYFNLVEWIDDSDMTDKEKDSYPSYITTGGYLKCYDYKQAFKNSYEKASIEDRNKVKKLPNFDKELFFEISGIMVDDENIESNTKEEIIELNGKKYKLID